MVLYTLYLFGTKLHHAYEVANFSKHVLNSIVYLSKPHKYVYNIQDEIWEIVSVDELLPFYDFVAV